MPDDVQWVRVRIDQYNIERDRSKEAYMKPGQDRTGYSSKRRWEVEMHHHKRSSNIMWWETLHCTAPHCTALNCSEVYGNAPKYTVLYCAVLHITAQQNTEALAHFKMHTTNHIKEGVECYLLELCRRQRACRPAKGWPQWWWRTERTECWGPRWPLTCILSQIIITWVVAVFLVSGCRVLFLFLFFYSKHVQ